MENTNTVPAVGVRREPSIDPVKAQGILTSVTKKEREAARQWEQRWGFLCRIRDVQEEEALKIGMTLEEYRAAVESVSCKTEVRKDCVVDKCPTDPLPPTSSGMVGRRVPYPLEKYGRLVKTAKDYPLHPPLPSGQIYDPYKQTLVFLGSVDGDPISHKQSPARTEITEEMLAKPHQLSISLFDFNKLFGGK